MMNNKIKNWIIGGTALVVAGGVFVGVTGGQDISAIQNKYDQASQIKAEYTLDNTALTKPAIDENSIKIKIGDEKSENFEPEFYISRWEDEVWFKIKPRLEGVAEKDKVLTLEGDKIKFETPKIDYHFYSLGNAYESEVILKEKPASNVITSDIETEGLDFFYQRELTQQEIDRGDYRPENMVGSYAVYHSTKANHILGQKNYENGKAFHIYRPQMEDANGWKVWGELFIDTEQGIQKVTMPEDFWNNAVYPIRHATGERFGWEELDPSTSQFFDVIVGSIHTGAAGDAISMSVFHHSLAGSGIKYKYAIYVNDEPNSTLVAATEEGTTTSENNRWRTLFFSSGVEVSAQDYWITVWNDDAGSGQVLSVPFDDGDADQTKIEEVDVVYDGNYPSPQGYSSTLARKYAIYVTYCQDPGPCTIFFDTGGIHTWTAPTGVTSADVACWGGGGGGHDDLAAGGGGGGGGAYAASTVIVVPSTEYTFVVGSGSAEADLDGVDSTFETDVIVAAGGKGATSLTGGAGGTTGDSIGDVESAGGTGGTGTDAGDTGGGGGGAGGPAGAGVNGVNGNGTVGGDGGAGNNGSGGAGGAGGDGAPGADGSPNDTGGGGGGGADDGQVSGNGGTPGAGGGGAEVCLSSWCLGADGQCTITYNISVTPTPTPDPDDPAIELPGGGNIEIKGGNLKLR